MKKYVKPIMDSEVFVSNDYIAACWKIKCNVPKGTGYYETNGIDGYQDTGYHKVNGQWQWVKGDDFIASGTGCGTWHNGVPGVPDDGPKANAMWQDTKGNYYEVYHFKQDVHGKGTLSDHFCTLGSESYETNPNAS